MHVVIRPDDAGRLLVEEHRELRRLHPGLGDVIGIVEADGQKLARQDRRQQANLVEGVSLARVVPVDDVTVVDDPGLRPVAGSLRPARMWS